LCACSGGNDGDSERQISLSTTALSFKANAPAEAATPAPQVVTATFGKGVANLTALHTGPAVERVEVAINGSSAQITVVPAAAQTLGAGVHRATIAITSYFCGDPACTRFEAGATQTVTASYQISPVVDEVAPRVAIAGTSATVSIRGVGFLGFNVQGVQFGTAAATSITVVNGNEIQATHPELPAGSYPITLDIPTHDGPITSTATLVVVDPVVHTPQALAWPAAVGSVYALEYDTLRGAVLAATDTGGGQLVRFAYTNDAWEPPATAPVANLRDAALSIDATRWLALTTTAITPVDPETLSLGSAVEAPSLPENSFLKSLATLNTGIAIITTGIAESATTPVYGYNMRSGDIAQFSTSLNNATARGAANGALIALIQGDPSLTTAPAVYVANAAGSIGSTSIALNQNAIPPALDRDATRIVLNGTRVYDSSSALLGTLPDTTAAVVLRPDGKRAYTYDTDANGVLAYDISETNEGEAFTPLGDAVPLVAAPGDGVRMAISADGNTLFIAGTTQLVVQPTPAL
jgi:hypothetical protein